MIIYYGGCVVLFGIIFGSFLNCTAMRLVRGEDFVRGRSHCPHCGHELTAIELIPVISFVIQGGRCRHCKEKISYRYILAEITFALLSLGLYLNLVLTPGMGGIWGLGIEQLLIFLRDWILTGCLFLVTLTDLENCEIYDGVLIFGFVNFLIFEIVLMIMQRSSLSGLLFSLLAGLAVGAVMLLISLLMDKLLKKESLGGGDIKLFALLGTYLGFYGAYELVIISCVLGLIFVAIRKLTRPDAPKEFPFGPAIALGGYILLITEKYITAWYQSFLI